MSEQIESALHCGGMAPSFENEVEYYRRRVAELEQRLRELEAAAEIFRDEQNGPPLPTRERQWFEALNNLNALLAKAGKAQGEGATT